MGRRNVKNSEVDSRKTVADFKISSVLVDTHWALLSPHPNFKIEL